MITPSTDIDETEYSAGQQAVADGMTVRGALERFARYDGKDPRTDARILSFAIGYLDGVLLHITRPLVVVEPSSPQVRR